MNTSTFATLIACFFILLGYRAYNLEPVSCETPKPDIGALATFTPTGEEVRILFNTFADCSYLVRFPDQSEIIVADRTVSKY